MRSRSIPLWICMIFPAWGVELEYFPAPAENPLRGLVPYVGERSEGNFPHSMEFRYFSLRQLMRDWGEYDWASLDQTLGKVSSRGNQLIFRVYIEYPGKGNEVPEFLQRDGVRVIEWQSEESDAGAMGTPDYTSPILRRAIVEFIAALGARYDGDPRIGFVTAGILGHWGEWHNYPREELWAPQDLQEAVMDAYTKAFATTKILLRYPAGEGNAQYSPNAGRPFGYHDDSFGLATLRTGRPKDGWFFLALMDDAGAAHKWRTQPIGGEISPDLWQTEFTTKMPGRAQDFLKCVEQTHVTWLMDSGMFRRKAVEDEGRVAMALEQTHRMGYEYHVAEATWEDHRLTLKVENRGVAPFYYDWAVELSRDGSPFAATDWKTGGIIPGEIREWRIALDREPKRIGLRVPNPMQGGKPLSFANADMADGSLVIELQ